MLANSLEHLVPALKLPTVHCCGCQVLVQFGLLTADPQVNLSNTVWHGVVAQLVENTRCKWMNFTHLLLLLFSETASHDQNADLTIVMKKYNLPSSWWKIREIGVELNSFALYEAAIQWICPSVEIWCVRTDVQCSNFNAGTNTLQEVSSKHCLVNIKINMTSVEWKSVNHW